MPKVSVIMPVYNTNEEFLKESIDSVLNQTFQDFEFIIVDDASTTDVRSVIENYQDSRILYYCNNQNYGAAYTRNKAIEKAQGEFITFLDSDDIAFPTKFEKQFDFFTQNPTVDCVGSFYLEIPKNSIHRYPTKHIDIELYLLINGCAFCQSCVMLRKSILTQNNISYQSQYVPAEDYGLWLDLIGKATFANIAEPLTQYRIHRDSISNTQFLKQEKCGALAKSRALSKYLDLSPSDQAGLYRLFYIRDLTAADIPLLEKLISTLVVGLQEKGYTVGQIQKSLTKLLTRVAKKTSSPRIVRTICFGPISLYLNIRFFKKMLLLLKKGII